MRTTLNIAALLLAGLLLAACEKDGPAERAGERIDEAADELQDGGEDLADAVEDACEEFKEGVDAKDRNC